MSSSSSPTATSDKAQSPMSANGGPTPPGKAMSIEQHAVDEGAQVMQSVKPIKHISQHACSFALYSHEMSRQIETHHFLARRSQEFLQCAVYDSDHRHAKLIGVEYVISDLLYESLPVDEQKLWHSHAYEVKSALWVNPRVPEMLGKPELNNMAKTYGKFWCTWQIDRGDALPMGAPALMVSPQAVAPGIIRAELVEKRNKKYNISTEALKKSRFEIEEPEWINPQADFWKQHGKGFAVDIVPTDMRKLAPFP